MAIPRFEPLVGTVDGINTVFDTPGGVAYAAGSPVLFVRGLPRARDNEDGFFETDPGAGRITIKEAPLAGDDVQLLWLEPTQPLPETELSPIVGTMLGFDDVEGSAGELVALSAALQDTTSLEGALSLAAGLMSELAAADDIDGRLKEC